MISRNRFVKLLLALCLAAHLNAQQDIRPLTILHTNDLHAHIQPDNDGMGGFAYLATALRNERAHCEACLYLDAGDLVQGTPVSTIYHGEPIYELANLLKPDASTLGNHELDYGWNEAGKFVTIAKFPIVSSNILNAVGQPVTGKPYVIQTVGGIRVAVIGAVLGDLATALTTPEEMGPWRVIPPVDAIRSVVAEIGGRADLIVVVAHIHSDETEKILHTIPQVAVVVAGHEHNGYRGLKKIDGRVAVEVQAYGVELGRLDLRVDVPHHTIVSADWKRIPINSKTISPDTEMAAAVAGWEAKVSKIVDVPIGVAKHTIAHRDLRTLVERAMAEETGADIAWINPGNIRDVLPKGQLLARHVWNVLPFDDRVVLGHFLGSQLPPAIAREFPLDPNKFYTIAVTDYTVANQSSPNQLATSGLKFAKTGPLQRDLVLDWIKRKGTVE
ncbi:MAG TPA: bifunctional UDP-sugar hydrolase/5'-nucleotidase [Bryobacteraceae bacterium]|nr:bifunctional UDP-sugar hydrolase/5'-nucleotidase [Bryobacteraceae bacterium]